MNPEIAHRPVLSFREGESSQREDRLAVEEPLEIRLGGRSLTVIMRTPGNDRELAAGLLFSEGIVRSGDEIAAIAHCHHARDSTNRNVIGAHLTPGIAVDWERLRRSFFSSTSCGLCGKTTIESVKVATPPLEEDGIRVAPRVLGGLPETLRGAQAVFDATGGLHACGLFDLEGNLLILREDVGRHNAVDKVIGAALLGAPAKASGPAILAGDGSVLPLSRCLMMVSGRASFEIVQKVLVARVPILCAVSAPSSLAVDLAREAGVTLIGFLREGTFNAYAGETRIGAQDPAPRSTETREGRGACPRT